MAKKKRIGKNRSTARRQVRCYFCGQVLEVSAKTLSTTCSGCHKAIKVEDVVIKTYLPVNDVQTCGMITVTKRGRIAAKRVQSGDGVVCEGSIEGQLETPGPVQLGPKSSWKGASLTSSTLEVDDGAKLNGHVTVPCDPPAEEDGEAGNSRLVRRIDEPQLSPPVAAVDDDDGKPPSKAKRKSAQVTEPKPEPRQRTKATSVADDDQSSTARTISRKQSPQQPATSHPPVDHQTPAQPAVKVIRTRKIAERSEPTAEPAIKKKTVRKKTVRKKTVGKKTAKNAAAGSKAPAAKTTKKKASSKKNSTTKKTAARKSPATAATSRPRSSRTPDAGS